MMVQIGQNEHRVYQIYYLESIVFIIDIGRRNKSK